ncbi:MAG: AAA family ATPase [Proteobacteria bacterium]|nr:MAG: AAA family ATPase [Pseudomonadota bacterium]QKK11560.1 MAG: AAA family ATPase [Pseudomonadota bacterium]
MNTDLHELELLLRSRFPIVVIETHEELRVLELFRRLTPQLGKAVLHWSATEGLVWSAASPRLEIDNGNSHNAQHMEPDKVLKHIKGVRQGSIFILKDFHPYLDEPLNVRLLREIALAHEANQHTVVLLSPSIKLPEELKRLCARFALSLPTYEKLRSLVEAEARTWSKEIGGKVKADKQALEQLVRNLQGLTTEDARRLARSAIYNDGAITHSDIAEVQQAKYRLLDMDGLLSFEYETAQFGEVGGLHNLKHWLGSRKKPFIEPDNRYGLKPPKGILLLGVQGGGKSLAAKAVAGAWGVPLLRLDFAALYNKFFGETERNLRDSLKMAEVMAPCVLWIDEIEKGIATDTHDSGTSRRVLGTLLTWMAERRDRVFLVATANDIQSLPPELIRKGRMDEIFFVDLPETTEREEIFRIHVEKRKQPVSNFNFAELARAAAGFSGSEIEQAVVAGLYAALADDRPLDNALILHEIGKTQPLSVVMAEKLRALREWAANRTVPAQGERSA